MKPLIGITTWSDAKPRGTCSTVSDHYIRSVAAAGGLPMLFPTAPAGEDCAAYVERLDGILFTGGGDVAPVLYGQEPARQVTSTNMARDTFEIALFRLARERGIPVMGICRGHQLINVAMGGTLIQDIPASIPGAGGHYQSNESIEDAYHHMDITDEGSRLFAAFGERRILTNSYHHQAVDRLASGLRPTARTPDGILEAFENDGPGGLILCVQCHPELLAARHPAFLRLFAELVRAAEQWRRAGCGSCMERGGNRSQGA